MSSVLDCVRRVLFRRPSAQRPTQRILLLRARQQRAKRGHLRTNFRTWTNLAQTDDPDFTMVGSLDG